jgi:hypothetical protein
MRSEIKCMRNEKSGRRSGRGKKIKEAKSIGATLNCD